MTVFLANIFSHPEWFTDQAWLVRPQKDASWTLVNNKGKKKRKKIWKRAQLMDHLNMVWCVGGRGCIFFHEWGHFCSNNGYLSPGQRKRGGRDKKTTLFKCLNTEKCPIMVDFESNKQTQKCYATEWVKRNAVIKQGALPLWQLQQDNLTWPFPFSSGQKKITVMPLWTVNALIVELTPPFSNHGNKVRLAVSGDLLYGIWLSFLAVPTREPCQKWAVQRTVTSRTFLSSFFFFLWL